MANNRVFYACHGVSVNGTTVQGAQSAGVTTNFNLEEAFQLGQLALYDNVPANPEVEFTLSKALDGLATIWNLSTSGGGSLISNANKEATVVLGVGSDTAATLSGASGATYAITMDKMTISSLSYSFGVDGNFTEDVTFIGNTKTLGGSVSAPAVTGSNLLRRQNFSLTGSDTVFPSEVAGKNLSSVTISADVGRESLYKLGQFSPYHKSISFPLEITTEIQVIADSVDPVAASGIDVGCVATNLMPQEQQIKLSLCDGTSGNIVYIFDLGTKNVLKSVAYAGGDTGGGNVTITYTYSTYNELTITG